jgi:phage baseplate assembly protein W
MALYKGFTTKTYGKCVGTKATNTGFSLTDIDLVKQDLINNIFTLRGERVMQPTFGTTIPNLLFEPLDEITVSLVEEQLLQVIRNDPRVHLLNLSMNVDQDNHIVAANILLQYVELNMVDGFELNIQFE